MTAVTPPAGRVSQIASWAINRGPTRMKRSGYLHIGDPGMRSTCAPKIPSAQIVKQVTPIPAAAHAQWLFHPKRVASLRNEKAIMSCGTIPNGMA